MKKKRILSGLLAMVMAFSLTSTAFAKEIAPASDKDTIKKGEEVNVTLSTDEDITGLAGMTIDTTYDNSLFTYKIDETTNDVSYDCGDYETVAATVKDSANEQAVMNDTVRVNVSTTNAKGTKITQGNFVTLTFVAKEDVSETKAGEFKSTVTYFEKAGTDKTNYASEFPAKSISVTVTPASAEAKGYSMEVKAVNPSVVVGDKVQVALKITNSDSAVTTYNAYHVVVSCDSDSLTYESSNLSGDTVSVDSGTAGTLKITGYGDNKTCGTNDIELTFTTTKVGTPKVTVTSAKVDAKANASAKDAPAATLTTAKATITVGGYKVTLPGDIFTGAGTVNPGENYIFTAKDTSKKYDFAGSTMGGNDVTIKDNGDGTYTIENVTGELVIKATEKVSKVKINLSGDAKDTVTMKSWGTATEVDAGTALWFMATPDSGKELVVTVNGDVITEINQQGQMRYTIAADKVTGTELDITVDYKAADTIMIKETGNAWDDVTDRNGNTWEAGGGTIAKPSEGSTYSVKFKLNTSKALEDYVATINGKQVEITVSNPRNKIYKFEFDPLAVAVDGVITIDFSYKQTEPTYTVDVSKYLELNGQAMYLVTAYGDVADGKVLAYGETENQMYWSDEYNEGNGAYAWLIIPDETNGTKSLDDLKTEATAAIKAVDGTKISIVYGGDVNLTKAVDINDAQFVWNMYKAEYNDDTTFQTVNRQKYLTADVNGDGVLNTTDAAAVVDIIKKQ